MIDNSDLIGRADRYLGDDEKQRERIGYGDVEPWSVPRLVRDLRNALGSSQTKFFVPESVINLVKAEIRKMNYDVCGLDEEEHKRLREYYDFVKDANAD